MQKRILIVDDNSNILEAIELILSEEGFDIKTLMSGNQVFSTALAWQPNAIILDLLLAGENGGDIAKEIKTNPKTSTIPILMISAHPNAEKTAIQSGADAFLGKPFDVSSLLKQIQKLLNK